MIAKMDIAVLLDRVQFVDDGGFEEVGGRMVLQFAQVQPQLITAVTEPIDEGEVLRYLGYPAGHRPNAHIQEMLRHWMGKARQRSTPRAAFVVLPVLEKGPNRLRVQSAVGEIEFEGAIGQFLSVSELLIVFIATAGPNVETLASELMASGEELPAMIVNAVGAERAEAAETAVIQRVHEKVRAVDLAPTLPYSPGYCGMALTEQQKLFRVFDGMTAGVKLTDACLMQPIKSVSGLVGLAPREVVKADESPCDRCELHSCNMRR